MSPAEKERAKRIFHYFDKDHKGYLLKSDIMDRFRVLYKDYTDDEYTDMTNKIFPGKSDMRITFSEFIIGIMSRVELMGDETLAKTFCYMDIQQKGQIRTEDIAIMYRRTGKELGEG